MAKKNEAESKTKMSKVKIQNQMQNLRIATGNLT